MENHVVTGETSGLRIGLHLGSQEKHTILRTKFLGNPETGLVLKVSANKFFRSTSTPQLLKQSPLLQGSDLINFVYDKSGLSLIEISDLLKINVRSIHFWRQNQKSMSPLYSHILDNLKNLIEQPSAPSTFKLREFLISEVLGKKTVLKEIQTGDQLVWEKLNALLRLNSVQRNEIPIVSENYYLSKMPSSSRASIKSVDIVESKKSVPKVRSIRKIKRFKDHD